MHQIDFDERTLHGLASKTVIITGGAGGIGSATAKIFSEHGANVVLADIPTSQTAAEKVIASLPYPSHAMYFPVDIVDWGQIQGLFKRVMDRFGAIHTVVANAGIMESKNILDMDEVDEDGDLLESKDASKVIDVNVKGTLNTLRLAMHYMKSPPGTSEPKSIIMVTSVTGYFGGADISAYTMSKHAIIGLLRDAHKTAARNNIRLTGVAPSLTPSRLTAGFYESSERAGYEANTPQSIGETIAQSSVDSTIANGSCIVICAIWHDLFKSLAWLTWIKIAKGLRREVELTRASILDEWMGADIIRLMKETFEFVIGIGGYPLPERLE